MSSDDQPRVFSTALGEFVGKAKDKVHDLEHDLHNDDHAAEHDVDGAARMCNARLTIAPTTSRRQSTT